MTATGDAETRVRSGEAILHELKCWRDMWLRCPLCLRICTLHYITCVHCVYDV